MRCANARFVFPEHDASVAEIRPNEGVALDEELKDARRTGEPSLANHLAGGVRDFDVIDRRGALTPIAFNQSIVEPTNILQKASRALLEQTVFGPQKRD
jgi:hypothetical protein